MKKHRPTREMVAQIIIEEMMKWRATSDEQQRRTELFDMCERLINYFALYEVIPDPATDPVCAATDRMRA
ncbi:hypothetical protein K7W03_23395 [Sphingobium sp. PNB]|uniref:hypothetical protein n=1 Tax=Sphingobium sp. PNB TaxID=863934 RepID=UPI001CA43635|nr:hypothetical protein [Sphingobium sp. PNB]MCB4862540.1 hypothetical protein [Sphingobium sp. PNB]